MKTEAEREREGERDKERDWGIKLWKTVKGMKLIISHFLSDQWLCSWCVVGLLLSLYSILTVLV